MTFKNAKIIYTYCIHTIYIKLYILIIKYIWFWFKKVTLLSFVTMKYIRTTYITTNGKIYFLSDLLTIQTNSLPRDSITLIIILVYIYLLSDFIDGANRFPAGSVNFHPRILVTLPIIPSTINRFSKNRKYDFWVLSRETTFLFDDTSAWVFVFSKLLATSKVWTFQPTWPHRRRYKRRKHTMKTNYNIPNQKDKLEKIY